ncbi:unnamed protein product [Diamesa tonsa]
MFLISLGFSIVLTGIWPYLDKLDPHAGKEFMGFIVAANPLGQMIFSPFVGWWANKLPSIRLPLLVSMAIFSMSSALYSSLDLLKDDVKYWMFIARFMVGVSSANIAVCRSYVSAATTLKERTHAVSMVSLAQVLGFVFGPALQAAVTPLGSEGFKLFNIFHINMYTASGWINVLMGVINFVMFLPFIFKDRRIAAREQMILQGKETEKETWKAMKPDYKTSWTLLLSFFVIVFNFVLLETLATSLTMDQFAWTKTQALYYMGTLMSVGAIIACVTFMLISPLSKRFQESNVLIWGGFFMMVLAGFVMIPYTGEPAQLASARDYMMENGTIAVYADDSVEILGCPETQEWCKYTPQLGFVEFLFGYILVSMGYPIGVTLIQTIFSKILGPRPQGIWMGLMTASGCMSRVMGPVFVGTIYTRFGTRWTFGVSTAMMICPMIWLYLLRNRLAVDDDAIKPVEMIDMAHKPQLIGNGNGNGNGQAYITGKSVIINENGGAGENEQFLNATR